MRLTLLLLSALFGLVPALVLSVLAGFLSYVFIEDTFRGTLSKNGSINWTFLWFGLWGVAGVLGALAYGVSWWRYLKQRHQRNLWVLAGLPIGIVCAAAFIFIVDKPTDFASTAAFVASVLCISIAIAFWIRELTLVFSGKAAGAK